MSRKTIRIEDPLIEIKIKNICKEKAISENKLINLVLEKSLLHDAFKTREEEIESILINVVTSNNKLIEVIEKQTEVLNDYIKQLNKILGE